VRLYGVDDAEAIAPRPLMYLALYSPDGRYKTRLYLRNYLTLHVKDELSRIPGIGGR